MTNKNQKPIKHVSRRDWCRQVARRTGLTIQESNKAINAVFDSVEYYLRHHESVNQMKFGRFTVHYWPARKGHTIPVKDNHGHIVKKGRSITVNGRYVPVLRPSIKLKQLIKKR